MTDPKAIRARLEAATPAYMVAAADKELYEHARKDISNLLDLAEAQAAEIERLRARHDELEAQLNELKPLRRIVTSYPACNTEDPS